MNNIYDLINNNFDLILSITLTFATIAIWPLGWWSNWKTQHTKNKEEENFLFQRSLSFILPRGSITFRYTTDSNGVIIVINIRKWFRNTVNITRRYDGSFLELNGMNEQEAKILISDLCKRFEIDWGTK